MMKSTMQAAVVEDFNKIPQIKEIQVPQPQAGQVLIKVIAASINNVTRSRANGSHYSADQETGFVAGLDGVGQTDDGKLYYFLGSEGRYGSFAQYTLVDQHRLLPLPSSTDAASLAASMNPALSSWMAIRQQLSAGVKGKKVLILGATGNAGKLAIEISRYLGAQAVIGVARNAEALQQLNLDGRVLLDDHLAQNLQPYADVDMVLDYLYGQPAADLMAALLAARTEHDRLLEWVQIGSISGSEMTLPANYLRSNNLRLLGSGLGSIATVTFGKELFLLAQLIAAGNFTVANYPIPLTNLNKENWYENRHRVVYLPNQPWQAQPVSFIEKVKFAVMKTVVSLKLKSGR
ncbi:zinc-binding alcohol dehydrogenase family protein [uncultured Limosilactobacillus sp.]|uniref:quinone oxidoreductase family protein n=1 Tax=uncultured Limosilactobacillus sp. TaxID=2837629 RepID=UPI0025E53B01|nr:zinc-binding alcohol dehydrogenase family protein [uncultured Limosilactobacillus sp.]